MALAGRQIKLDHIAQQVSGGRMHSKTLGIAVVGAGKMGELRAHIAMCHPAVQFLAIADADAARAAHVAEKAGAQFHSSDNLDVVSRPEVNAVIISSSEHAHVEPIIQAVELGKPVLCEKPIGLSLEDADRVMEAIERNNGNVRFGYSRRFKERYLSAKEHLTQGRLGTIVGGHARAYNLRAQARKGAERSKGLTPVVYSLTYYIDLMCWFLEGNPVVEVFARGKAMKRQDGAGENVHDVTWAILTCSDGAVINAGICYALPEQYPSRGLSTRVELIGTEGVMLLDGDNTDGDFWGPLASETRAWLDYLSTGRPCVLATAADARRNLEISLAIERSEYSGERVRLPLEK
jgi:predicted dehydrogenase